MPAIVTQVVNSFKGKVNAQTVAPIAGTIIITLIKVLKEVNWKWCRETADDLHGWMSDAPTNISGTWQLDDWPMAIRRDGKTFSLVVSPANPQSPVLVGGAVKTSAGIEVFAFQGNDIDGTAVRVALWLSDARTLLGKIWKEDEVPGEDEESTLQLVKRS